MFFMKSGNWTAVRNAFLAEIPIDRPLSSCEFCFIVTDIYKRGKRTSIRLLAKQAQWSRYTVRKYLLRMGLGFHNSDEKNNPAGGFLYIISNSKAKKFRVCVPKNQVKSKCAT